MNTTNFIQNLFNNDPMIPENIYEPSGICIGDTVLDNTPSGFALFQAIGGHYTLSCSGHRGASGQCHLLHQGERRQR